MEHYGALYGALWSTLWSTIEHCMEHYGAQVHLLIDMCSMGILFCICHTSYFGLYAKMKLKRTGSSWAF
jgi:hypothetical protein